MLTLKVCKLCELDASTSDVGFQPAFEWLKVWPSAPQFIDSHLTAIFAT